MISELLAYDFMQRAILAVIAISIFSPILGLFLILRRQSLMRDFLGTINHLDDPCGCGYRCFGFRISPG